MSRIWIITKTIVILSIVFSCVSQAGAKIETIAKIGAINGDVQVSMVEGKWAAASEGMELKTGAMVKTGGKSSCVITWNQGNLLKMASFTNIRIDRLDFDMGSKAENSSLNLWSGKVYVNAKKLSGADSSFEVRTATAVAGVRGTKFYIEVDADETSFVGCADGIVSVAGQSGSEVVLTANQVTVVKKGEAPSAPKQMSAESLQSFSELEDSIGATLEIMQPVGNLETDTTPVTVKGKTDPGNTVSVNGQSVTADESGFFAAGVDLIEGVNHIKIEARNKKGKVTARTRVVKYRTVLKDIVGPILEISRPAGGFGADVPGCSAVGTVSIQCEITGWTEPDVVLTINRIRCAVEQDGSFSCPVTVAYTEPVIEVAAIDPAGNRTSVIIRRNIQRNKVEYLEITVSPSSITINGQDTATITVRAYNLLHEPVSSEISIQSSLANALSQPSVTTDAAGSGSVIFLPGIDSAGGTVNITASADSVSARAVLIMRPDVPLDH